MARVIQFEGRQISVPDDASDDEVAGILQSQPAAAPAPPPESGIPPTPGVTRVEIPTGPKPPERPVSLLPSSVGGAVRDFGIGAQGVGAGLRDIALMPFDLAAGAQNLVAGGINKVFGTEIPSATPASQMAEKMVEPFSIPKEDMSSSERLFNNISRFGTQAVGTGAALATRAPAVAEAAASRAKPAGDLLNRTLDTMARPYQAAPTRTLVGDTVGGAGAGVGVDAAEKYLPKEPASGMGELLKGLATFFAPLLGGMAATTVQGTAQGLAGTVRNLGNRRADVNVPMKPSGESYNLADTERAAGNMQQSVTGTTPRDAAFEIRQNADELRNAARPGEVPVDPSQMPTSGLLSRDPGLVTAETAARTKNGGEFIPRDQNVKEAAGQRVNSLRDPEADQSTVAAAAQVERDARVAPVQQRVDDLESLNTRVDNLRQQQGAEFAPAANTEAKANASRNLDRTIVDENYVPDRTEKNRQFDTAPGRTEQLPADDVFGAIDRIRANANGLAPGTLPNDFMRRLDELRPVIDETGVNVGGPGTAAGGDLADLRKFIGPAMEQAQRTGNFDLADNLAALKRSINATIENAPGYAEANANYGRFADRYRPERNDEAAKFTREIDRGGNTDGVPNRGATPPSETAGRFLSSPEKAAALQRILDGAPNAHAGQAAVRDYMRSDFAMTALNPDGTLNPARASAWVRNNASVLEQFPAVRTEFDGLVQTAQRGQQLSTTARTELDTARKNRKTTEADVDRSAIGTLLREDPRDVASKILNGGYGAERQLDEITALVKSDPAAARGWKSAVSEVLTDKVNSSRKIGETPEVQYARLAKEFKDNEALLAKVYTPEEMNTLRQGHKLLSYFKEAEKRATTGSPTAERTIPQWLQLGARHVWGDLKGGGIIKRFKLMLDLLPTNKQNADEIVHMAWFNPDVAAYLLERPVKNPDIPQYNISLRRLLAADNAARESGK